MKLTSEALRELYQKETARSARLRDSECLPAEMLTSAAAGELSETQRGVVADHLATCSSCAKEYREIRSLKSWAESEAGNAKSSAEIPATRIRVLRLPDRGTSVYQPFWRRMMGAPALAVVLLIVTLLLGMLLISQRRENDRLVAQVNEKDLATAEATRRAEQAEAARSAVQQELTRRAAADEAAQQKTEVVAPKNTDRSDQPLVNVPIFELEPRGSTRNSGSETVTLEAASDTRLITLILHVDGELSQNAYSLEVLDPTGKPVWASRGLRKNRYNNFTVALPRRTFPAGDYRLKLYSLRDGRREIVEEYAMRLQYR